MLIRNLVITPVTPETLHEHWPFLLRGARDILKRIRPPESSSWLPEDLYAALRHPESSHEMCWIASRNNIQLGWVAGHLQRDPYGGLEFFLWDAWSLPLGERTAEMDIEGGREQLLDYVKLWAKGNGATRISTYSYRKLEALGWTRSHTLYYQSL